MSTATHRDLQVPKLQPGVRVRYDSGKWDSCANCVRFVSEWATQSWAYTKIGTVVADEEFSGHIFPRNSPWGIPDFASIIRFDGEEQVTWIRTSCLDVIGFVSTEQTSQGELFPGVS